MVTVDLLKFTASLLIVGTVLRLASARLANTSVGKALAFAY